MRAFLTGSRVYGTPRDNSDLDLVVFVSPEDEALIRRFGTVGGSNSTNRFGMLNVITCTDEKQFIFWKMGTEQLKREAPVTRQRAIEVFTAYGVTQANGAGSGYLENQEVIMQEADLDLFRH